MNFKRILRCVFVFVSSLSIFFPLFLSGQDIFIYRPDLEKKLFNNQNKISLHGEYFGQFQAPSSFPSYNDLSGPVDRWTYGFQNILFLTKTTTFLAQLVTHDDGGKRTKFDWHFSLRQVLYKNITLILGHDSNHDSDYQSQLNGRAFYLNRNYVGIGLPFKIDSFYFEPFTWFFHHTNHKGHLDYSGENLSQEWGVRAGYWYQQKAGISLQVLFQTESIFSLGQAVQAHLIIRIKLLRYLELSIGTSLWRDLKESRLGIKQKYSKFTWGIAIPF